MMHALTYRQELKAPGKWTGLDFENPKLAPTLRILTQTLRQQSRRFVPPPGVEVERLEVPLRSGESIDCFVLSPAGRQETLPAMLYCHGGGFFLPIQPMMLALASQYAREVGIRVFLPEYRFLPEHPAPAALWDCQDTWSFLQTGAEGLKIDPKRVLLYGESAGGTLAAGLALWARDGGRVPPIGQLLVYPALDDRCESYPSARRYEQAAWPLRNNLAMWRGYLRDLPADGLLVPMRAEDLSALPPSYIEPQELDVLHDEAVAYAQRLERAQVRVTVNDIPGSYHGFDADTENPFVREVVQMRTAWMSDLLL